MLTAVGHVGGKRHGDLPQTQKRTLHIGIHVWAEETTDNAAVVAEARRLTDAIRAKNADSAAAWRERAVDDENRGTVNGVPVAATAAATTGARPAITPAPRQDVASYGTGRGAGRALARGAAVSRPRGAAVSRPRGAAVARSRGGAVARQHGASSARSTAQLPTTSRASALTTAMRPTATSADAASASGAGRQNATAVAVAAPRQLTLSTAGMPMLNFRLR